MCCYYTCQTNLFQVLYSYHIHVTWFHCFYFHCSRRGFNYKYVNTDLAKYLQDLGPWDSTYGSASAAIFGPTSKPNPVQGPSQPVKTVAYGFQSIPETLMQEFLNTDDKQVYCIYLFPPFQIFHEQLLTNKNSQLVIARYAFKQINTVSYISWTNQIFMKG